MKKISPILICLAAFLWLPDDSALAQKLPWHPKQGEPLSGASRVLLVPPTVHVEKWTVNSGYETQGTADHVRRTICGTLDQILEERQVQVEDYLICLGESETGIEKQKAVAAVGQRFRELAADWATLHRSADRLEQFHLGDELAVTKKLGVDALVVVDANGILTTKGERAMAAVASMGGGGQSLVLHIGVIRAQTGELLFFTESSAGGDFMKHPERLENALEKAMGTVFGQKAAAKDSSHP